MGQKFTSKALERAMPLADLRVLPGVNPGKGRPWIDPVSHAIIVGALGTFGMTQATADGRYSQLTHNHDDRYYTETEINALLSTKQAAITGDLSVPGNLYVGGTSVVATNQGIGVVDAFGYSTTIKSDGPRLNVSGTVAWTASPNSGVAADTQLARGGPGVVIVCGSLVTNLGTLRASNVYLADGGTLQFGIRAQLASTALDTIEVLNANGTNWGRLITGTLTLINNLELPYSNVFLGMDRVLSWGNGTSYNSACSLTGRAGNNIEITASSTKLSGVISLGSFTVGTLPNAASNPRSSAYVVDSSVDWPAGTGQTVAGGGSYEVPVKTKGSLWLIG